MAEEDQEKQKESRAVKMQKLRRAVERVRNVRSSEEDAPIQKKSWLTRLKEQVGLGEMSHDSD